MLLIIFLGLIAKLTLVSSECDIGTQDVENFDWYKFTGTRSWYWVLHTPNYIDNFAVCPITTYAQPEGNNSLITTDEYLKSKRSHVRVYRNATNWNSTGYWEEYYGDPYFMTVPIYVIAVDYDRYAILKYCFFHDSKPDVYVLYRSQYPDKATVEDVQKKLKQNKIDFSQMKEYGTDHCQ